MPDPPLQTDHRKYLILRHARQNNLKNISLSIPHKKLVVITGVSGSGKTSLAFDTLFAEGQRRYVESLSAYIRQFMGKHKKPDVEYIKGLAPAIAIQQHVLSQNPRSTIGTTTEVYDYLKILFARLGRTFSPDSGEEVKKHSVRDVLEALKAYPDGTKAQIAAPIEKSAKRTWKDELQVLLQKGFTRLQTEDNVQNIQDILEYLDAKKGKPGPKLSAALNKSALLVDRISVKHDDPENDDRIADSTESAFFEGHGQCLITVYPENGTPQPIYFSNKFEADGKSFPEPTPNLFTFNNPYGACPECEGFGLSYGVDEDKVIPDKSLSVYDKAVACWRGDKMQEWWDGFVTFAKEHEFPIHKPYKDLSEEDKLLLWEGAKGLPGINSFFRYCERKTYKIQYRVLLARYKGKSTCPACKGGRLRPEANHVKIAGRSITDLCQMPVRHLIDFFDNLKLQQHEQEAARRILTEVTNRLRLLNDIGLGYLTLHRPSNTLSGGESQRARLVTSLGSNLTGALYILDEPTIGLHPVDNERLVGILKEFRDLGNSVIVVEHDETIMRSSDHLIDMGPLAGEHGGEVVFQGSPDDLNGQSNSLTAQYLTGKRTIPVPARRRKASRFIEIRGASRHNLQSIDVRIPINLLTVVTGISGSGKSTLVNDILYQSLRENPENPRSNLRFCKSITGTKGTITSVEYVSQKPIGRSSRSNPVTYLKVFDDIRERFAQQPLSKMRGFTSGHFSFNIEGGRCEMCKGEGFVTVEMQFMADIQLECEYCKGKRYKSDILDIRYRGQNIADVLNMTVSEAMEFFGDKEASIVRGLQPLVDVGLDYLRLGQPSINLSGGEAQRIKLASFLVQGRQDQQKVLFIFDEPTTGLHFHDIQKLLNSFEKLISNGHTLLVIEHNPDVIKSADWLIDLGPEGGDEGGELLYQGPPEGLKQVKASATGRYLAL